MSRAAIVFNPIAGSGYATRQAERAAELLRSDGWQVELLATKGPGDAEPLARSVAQRVDLLVVAGGDGSIREAIAGLGPEARRVEIAILPCGNANVVARELNVPRDAEGSLRVLREGAPRTIDLGRAGEHLFLAMVGIGWDARTVRILSRLRRTRIGGWWYRLWADSAYLFAGLAALFVRRRDRFEIVVDGRPSPQRYCAALIANFRCYGKGWAMVPDAGCASGRLHFQARKRFGAPFVAWQLIAAMLQRRVPRFISDHDAGTEVVVRAERPFLVQADGDEHPATAELVVRVEPGAARVRVPSP